MQETVAASSSSAWHLNRDSQNRPLTLSSLFAARAINSFSRPINQLRRQRRLRSWAIRSGQSARARMSSSAGGIGTPPTSRQVGRGRKAPYGPLLPPPEQLRQDAATAWGKCPIFAAG